MNRMILANLRSRPLRSLIGVIAVAIEVAMILLLVGLTNGMIHDARNRLQGLEADILVRPPSTSAFMQMSGNILPTKLAAVLARQPGVKAATPVAMQVNSQGLTTIGGIDLASFSAVSGGLHFVAGGPGLGPGQVIVDDLYAESNRLHVGEKIPLLGHPFTITGIFEHGKGSRLYMGLKTLDDLIGAPEKAAVIYVKLDVPAQTQAMLGKLRALLPGYQVEAMQEYLTMFTANKLPFLPIFQGVLISIAVIIGFLVIFLTMYTTILERTRDIGILKALGASKLYIVQAILRETGALAVVGIGAGIGLTQIVRASLHGAYPTLPILMQPAWVGWAALIAIVGAMIGALYPASRAAAQDAIAALAYE